MLPVLAATPIPPAARPAAPQLPARVPPGPPRHQPPRCHHPLCKEAAVVHWTRRLTLQEAALVPARHRTGDLRRVIEACARHAIGIDLAARVHAATCSGPESADLPRCDCDPEPLPGPFTVARPELPDHWRAST